MYLYIYLYIYIYHRNFKSRYRHQLRHDFVPHLRHEIVAITESHHPWTFQVVLEKPPLVKGIEFAPGEFACESEAVMKTWMAKIQELATGRN